MVNKDHLLNEGKIGLSLSIIKVTRSEINKDSFYMVTKSLKITAKQLKIVTFLQIKIYNIRSAYVNNKKVITKDHLVKDSQIKCDQ